MEPMTGHQEPMMDAEGIRIDLIDTENRGRFGHPSWVIPLGGGTVREGGVTVEVRPAVDMATDRWRDYDAIEKLADKVERGGGFMWHGDEIHVDNEICVGRDALRLLTTLWKRAGEREGDKNIAEAAYKQGFDAAKRELVDAVRAIESPEAEA